MLAFGLIQFLFDRFVLVVSFLSYLIFDFAKVIDVILIFHIDHNILKGIILFSISMALIRREVHLL